MTLLSATILLFLVTDPLGNIPLYLACLKDVDPARHRRIILREVFFTFLILAFFLFFGRYLLQVLNLSEPALQLAGGIILFLIALRMIFPQGHGPFGDMPDGEPFIFPLAVPLLAGPSAVATVLLFASKEPDRLATWFLAIAITCAISATILACSPQLHRIMGTRGLNAMERLMGMLLVAIAVQMCFEGIEQIVMAW